MVVFPRNALCSFVTGSIMAWRTPIRPAWLHSGFQRVSVSPFLEPESQPHPHTRHFSLGSEDPTQLFHAYKASTSVTEPSPLPLYYSFYFRYSISAEPACFHTLAIAKAFCIQQRTFFANVCRFPSLRREKKCKDLIVSYCL